MKLFNLLSVYFFILILHIPAFSQKKLVDARPQYEEFRKNCIVDKMEYTTNRTIVHFRYRSTGKYTSAWIYPKGFEESWHLMTSNGNYELLEVKNVRRNGKLEKKLLRKEFKAKGHGKHFIITCEVHFPKLPNTIKQASFIEGLDGAGKSYHFNCPNIQLKTFEKENTPLVQKSIETPILALENITENETSKPIPSTKKTPLISSEQSWQVYPNPAKDHIIIDLKDFTQGAYIELYSMDGKRLAQIQSTDKLIEIDLSTYPAGLYCLNLQSGKHNSSKKINIQ